MTRRLTYYKRYRMEADLLRPLPQAVLPAGYDWLPWGDDLIDRHADVKHACFRDELDAVIFPNFATPSGCRDLMRAIRYRDGFCPAATWLAVGPDGPVGTVQGRCDSRRLGAIQNVGVVPGHRGLGIGEALLLKALNGFRSAGMVRAYLEVTARNDAAIALYRRYGFRCHRTFYKAVVVGDPVPVGAGI